MELIVALYLLLLWMTGSFRSVAHLCRALFLTGIVLGLLLAGSLFSQGRTVLGVAAFIAPFAAGLLLVLLLDALRDRSARRSWAV